MTGIRKTETGWQAYVWVVDPSRTKGGFQASKRFPPDTSLSEMKQWRKRRSLNVAPLEPVTVPPTDVPERRLKAKNRISATTPSVHSTAMVVSPMPAARQARLEKP